MERIEDNIAKGTTTLALICKKGVVLATDSRATFGNLIASTSAKKVYEIDKYIGATIAGSVGDAQNLMKFLKGEAALYKIENEEEHMPVNACANVSAAVFTVAHRQNNYYSMALIIVGVDRVGPRIFSIDVAGGVLEEPKFTSTGSGSNPVRGILKDRYKEDMSIEKGVNLAIRAINVAVKIDSASGNTIKVATITKEKGFVEIDQEYVEAMIVELDGGK